MTEDAPESFEAKLEQLEALTQALQSQNLELRLRLQQRKSRWAFERRLLAIGGLGLLLLGLVVGLFLGLVVGPVRPLATAAAVWAPDHVVIVIEENLSARNLAPELTYLNSLLHQGANFTNSHGINHPSQPNYLALFSGDPQGTGSDAKRNPDGSSPSVNLPFTEFPTDDAGFAKLPTVAFVIPNQIHDGHKSDAAPPGIDYGRAMDDWLRQHIEPYRRWALSHNSLLIITWDEDEDAYT